MTKEEIMQAIEEMTVLELSELVKAMEEKAAVYCRLSQDDGSVGESGSIQTHVLPFFLYAFRHCSLKK